ncbi:hypothetical protein [Bradyrhizobium japonicum]|uniref:hypothetical protein n=1 Tax=Bradyrhizobium japonicum TaxID=375 RepID=UPI001BA717D0|nr:hypothetical protein [Bradyrhizobium japonicum]MBR0956304.1 hypothetical protein [Bradyrhizobium japonicum]
MTNSILASQSRRDLISTGTLAVAAGIPLAFATRANADEAKPMLMFVQMAPDLKVDRAAQTLRLVNVVPQTLYFADRPERIAGHVTMTNYLAEWTSKAGKDNFGNDPPNAALSVYEPGQPNNTLAVVVLSNPKVEGADLVYNFKLLNGNLPASGGATAVFIDWIGVGGGVGLGFHGVGVGFRGRGFR